MGGVERRLILSQTQWTHYPSADKCHQLPAARGSLLSGGGGGADRSAGVAGGSGGGVVGVVSLSGGWQSNGRGEVTTRRSQMKLAGRRRRPTFRHSHPHLSFPLKPPVVPAASECSGLLLKGQRYRPKMRQDMTAACLLGLDLHCQMFGGGPRRGIHTSILRAACGPPLSPLTDGRTRFYPLLWAACASIKVPSCLHSRFSNGINCSDLG